MKLRTAIYLFAAIEFVVIAVLVILSLLHRH